MFQKRIFICTTISEKSELKLFTLIPAPKKGGQNRINFNNRENFMIGSQEYIVKIWHL
ncbi:protein of unknown function [Legionella micdadei]|uniref:Uncharacterized protein n=1 Tax=Legionella micdadei TaxID=451 RepID=A0A098GE13_LEGMI|nr:protein of unknown function [Legionella micdadei]